MEHDPLIDSVINGRYHVIRLLGEGGMSAVYEVEHKKLKRQFALKRLLPSLSKNPEALVRFEREAELLASLRHPNVVDIIDWDQLPDACPFMVLEFLHGASIRVRMDRGQLPWEAIARIGDQCMAALALAHRIGITHRDLKPENIFISIDDAGDERVKLLDFGVSKMRGLGRTTGQHALLGTPSYMSPEQGQGLTDEIGPKSDVWAMATILYEMATRKVAFTGEDLMQTVINITSARPTPIQALRPDAPEAFVDLVDRATSPEADRRIMTIEELRMGLRAALEPKQTYRINTPVSGMAALPRSAQTVSPTQRTPTPVPGSVSAPRQPTPVPGSISARQPTPVPGVITAAFTAITDEKKPAPAKSNVNVWMIAATAIVAVLGVLIGAVVF